MGEVRKIEVFIFRLQPQLQIQNLLEELVEAVICDLSLTRVLITLYLPSSNPIQAEAVKKDNGEIVKTFRMTWKETPGKIEEGMSTFEITDRDVILGRIYLWRGKAEKPWDFLFLVPYLETVELVLRKAMIEWDHREALEKIANLLGEETKDQSKRDQDEGATKRLNEQVVRLDESLQESEKEFLNLFNLSRDSLFIINSEGCYLAVNKAARELLGYSKDQILSMNAFRQNTDGAGICWKVGLGVERCEIVNREGKPITVEVSLTPFRYQGSDCFLGSMRGVDRYEEQQEKLMDKEVLFPENGNEKKEELSLDFFDNLNDAVVIMDEDGIILYCNRKAESIFGYAREKIVGKSLTKLMPERYREFRFSALKNLIAGEKPRIIDELLEAEGMRNNGEEFPLEFSISPIQKNGTKQFLSIIRDASNKQVE